MQQHQAEIAALLAIYEHHQPRTVLEIGAYHGGTLQHWLKGTPDVMVVVDDFFLTDGPALRAAWQSWTPDATRLEIIPGHSQADGVFAAVEQHAPFDWAFIDANHTYNAVRADWERYRPLCNGIVAFHDILPPSRTHPEIQVSRLWREIKRAGYKTRELINDPHAAWGGIGVVFLDGKAVNNGSGKQDSRVHRRTRGRGSRR